MQHSPSRWKSFKRLLQALGFAAGIGLLAGNPAIAQIVRIHDQNWIKIVQAPEAGSASMHFPRAISFDAEHGGKIIKKILVNWQVNPDVVMFPMSHGWTGSINGGFTWDTPAPTMLPEVDMMGAIRRVTDGTMLAIPYFPNPTVTGSTPASSFTFSYHTSADRGVTWTKHSDAGLIDFGTQRLGLFRFHRGIFQNNDGTLFAPAYGQFPGPSGFQVHRSLLMQSTNGGQLWTYRSTVTYVPGVPHNETSVVRCKNGDFLAVIRIAGSLQFTRSTDEGLTWAPSASVPGLPANIGTDPYLWLMPNGILVLAYGDNVLGNMRHCYLAYSVDGNGAAWTNVTRTFTSSTTAWQGKSSGYTSVVPLSAHRFLQISDRALTTYYSPLNQVPNPYSIWKKTIDIVLQQRNRIDLKTKYDVGAIAVVTDMTDANAVFPEARPAGAFDGSTEYWSGAFKAATSGSYTIDLGKNTSLSAIGVCLQYNRAQSAVIESSRDGATWTALKTYANETHNAIDYTDFAESLSARYVRVTVNAASAPVCLNEIELYSTSDTYENDATEIAPFGYATVNGGFQVSDDAAPPTTGYQSERALLMDDSDAANTSSISKSVAASVNKVLTFRIKPLGYANDGFIEFGLLSGGSNAFRLAVFPDGSVKYHNGSTYVDTSGSGAPAGASTIPLNAWSEVRLDAKSAVGTAILTVDGVVKGTVGDANRVGTLDGLSFGSSGDTAVGDRALFDDVSISQR